MQFFDINEYYGVPVVGNTANKPKPPGYTPFKRHNLNRASALIA